MCGFIRLRRPHKAPASARASAAARTRRRVRQNGTFAVTSLRGPMRLIADGTVDREGVSGLAARLGYTTRQLERRPQAETGAVHWPWPAHSAPRARGY